MNGRLLLMALVMAVVGTMSASPSTAAPALPGKPCEVEAHSDWKEPESWAWTEICEGRIADFNACYGRFFNGRLDPKEPEGWDDKRKLGQSFLETILLHEPFRSAIPRQGVRIVGAWFEDPIDLAYANIAHMVWLELSRFEASVDLSFIKISALVSLEGSKFGRVNLSSAMVGGLLNMIGATFEGPVDMDKLQVESSLFMRGGASFKEDVILRGAKVGGQLSMSASTFEGPVDMDKLQVESSLFMSEGTSFTKDVILRGAKVGGQLSMSGSTFEGPVNMDSLQVAGNLFIRRKASFKEDVSLNGAKVGGQLVMSGSTFERPVNMDSLQVASNLFMRGGAFKEDVILHSAKVGGKLDMSGSTFEGPVNMDKLQVESSLFMSEKASFKEDAILSNAKVGGQLNMTGSTFEGSVNMANLEVASHLFMRGGASFKKDVILNGAKVGGQLAMLGSTFEGSVSMYALQVESSLLMRGGASFKEDVILTGAKVGGQLAMSGSTFEGPVGMSSLEVASHLFMSEEASFKKDVILSSAKVGGGLSMIGSTFEGSVNMDKLQVGSSLFMSTGDNFKEDLILRSAKVGGVLSMIGSTFEGPVEMGALQVESSLFMGADFRQSANLIFAEIGTDLDLSGAQFHELDLTGTRIGSELRLGSGAREAPKWANDGELILRNTQVGAIQDRWSRDKKIDAWPDKLQLGGFTYERLGGFRGAGAKGDMLDREVEWYYGWLKRDRTFSPQPYHHLANLFRAAGQIEKANDILHAVREQERELATGLKWWGLTLLNSTIGYGYGYRYFRALYWMIALVLLGAVVLRTSGQGRANKMPWGLSYSLDHLLPIIELRKYHYDQIQLTGWPRYYFYFHKLMGYVLASFLIAGLAGLTQG